MTLPDWCACLKGTRTVGKGILLICLLIISAILYFHVTLKTVTLVIDSEVKILATRANTVGQLLEEEGLYVRSRDTLQPDASVRVEKGMDIHLRRALPVFIHVDGKTRLVYVTGQTVAELLRELSITVSLRDRVEPGLQAAPERGSSIVITRVGLSTFQEEEEIPFATEKKNDPSMPLGQRKTVIEGKSGVLRSTFEVILADNIEESRTLVEQIRLREPVNSVVLIGTGEPVPVITASARGGQVVNTMEGLASWYGSQNDGLHGARTASGEIFNRNEYTAAHPTFPFGTRLRVTYLKTGRSVEVRVNDRGPWDGKRIIDLSMVAAEAIGLRSAGVGLVRIEVLQ